MEAFHLSSSFNLGLKTRKLSEIQLIYGIVPRKSFKGQCHSHIECGFRYIVQVARSFLFLGGEISFQKFGPLGYTWQYSFKSCTHCSFSHRQENLEVSSHMSCCLVVIAYEYWVLLLSQLRLLCGVFFTRKAARSRGKYLAPSKAPSLINEWLVSRSGQITSCISL